MRALKGFKEDLGKKNSLVDKKQVVEGFLKDSEKKKLFKTNTDRFSEKFIRALKVLFSILTLGVAAIPFALHSKKYYGAGLFGSRQASRDHRFVNRAKIFTVKLGVS